MDNEARLQLMIINGAICELPEEDQLKVTVIHKQLMAVLESFPVELSALALAKTGIVYGSQHE